MRKFKDFYGNETEDTENDLVELLKRVYDGEAPASYMAGTLLCSKEDGSPMYDFNVMPDVIDRLSYWIAKNYIAHKTKTHHYWEAAHKVVKHCEERNIT